MECNPFEKFDKQWALVTAGDKSSFNSMTISWGSMGTLWFKDIITIYIRPDRYTWKYLNEHDTFTVSFYPKKYHRALRIMGSVSGRDVDKVKAAGLTPVFGKDGITYEEAAETFVLKKIYMDQLDMEKFPKDAFQYYEEGAEAHYMIIGEVIDHSEGETK